VAAAELAQMAGAQRVEGTLFGNGYGKAPLFDESLLKFI
jgi:isopropylmalate/homocitrate/citramalate synthase